MRLNEAPIRRLYVQLCRAIPGGDLGRVGGEEFLGKAGTDPSLPREPAHPTDLSTLHCMAWLSTHITIQMFVGIGLYRYGNAGYGSERNNSSVYLLRTVLPHCLDTQQAVQ